MRPRIRTLKPEMWQDEKVGDLCHGARLLFVGLITMADDEGRLRELPDAIRGHVFPYDGVPAAKLERWLTEIAAAGMVVRYERAGKRYIAFPHWNEHQKVDRPNASDLPSPGPFDDPSSKDRRVTTDPFDDRSHSPRTRGVRSRSDPVVDVSNSNVNGDSKPERPPSKRADQTVLPLSLPGELHHSAHLALTVLRAVQAERGGDEPTLRGVGLAVQRFPNRDHATVVRELEHWALAGTGQTRPVKDWARTFATFLERSPAGKPVRVGETTSPDFSAYDRAAGL